MYRRRSTSPVLLMLLATLSGLALVGCVAAVVLMASGQLAGGPARMVSLAIGMAALAFAFLRLLLVIGESRTANALIRPASELTTLTFPPMPRVRRSRPERHM